MISRTIAMALGLTLAVTFSQLPEFSQQYRQRIGGVIFVTGLLVFIGSIWLGWVSSGSAMNPPEQLSPAGSER